MKRRWSAREARFADDIGPVGRIDDDEVVRRNRSQADGIRRIRLVGPLPDALALTIRRSMNEAALLKHTEHLLHVVLSVLIGGRERQLERGALHVVDQD